MADEFTISKLKEWKLENCIEKFKGKCYYLNNNCQINHKHLYIKVYNIRCIIYLITYLYLDECIDSEALLSLTELMLKDLIPQMGYRAKLLKGINELKTKSSIINTVSIYIFYNC